MTDSRTCASVLCASQTDGSDENNTYAKWTPTAELTMTVNNPALLGKIRPGEEYYLDFVRAE